MDIIKYYVVNSFLYCFTFLSVVGLGCIYQMWQYDAKFFFFLLMWYQNLFTSGIKKHDGSELLMVLPKVTAAHAVTNIHYSILYRVSTTSG